MEAVVRIWNAIKKARGKTLIGSCFRHLNFEISSNDYCSFLDNSTPTTLSNPAMFVPKSATAL